MVDAGRSVIALYQGELARADALEPRDVLAPACKLSRSKVALGRRGGLAANRSEAKRFWNEWQADQNLFQVQQQTWTVTDCVFRGN